MRSKPGRELRTNPSIPLAIFAALGVTFSNSRSSTG